MNDGTSKKIELEVRNLKKYYKAGRGRYLKAVDDVSFSIFQGETLGIVGESGCGKTTTMRAILNVLPSNGNV